MKSYRLKLEASEDTKTVKVTLQDLGFTEEEWQGLSHDEQMSELQKYADDLPEQPYWYVGTAEEL